MEIGSIFKMCSKDVDRRKAIVRASVTRPSVQRLQDAASFHGGNWVRILVGVVFENPFTVYYVQYGILFC